ncbi:MAG: hypothetical protein WDO16_10760 [Bacteroidota bacterium]
MSSVKNKLYNQEQAPPAKVWDKINAALDESHIADEFPSRLYNSEAIPPAAVWDRIIGSLDNEDPKVVPMIKRNFPLFRYAAAVAVIALAVFGIIKWTGTNDTSAAENAVASKEHISAGNKGADVAAENSIAENNTERENITGEEGNSHTATSEVKARTRKIKDSYVIDDNIAATTAIYAYNEHTPNLADRYVMLMTPNGIVRMSKKLGSIVCCVAGEEEDKDCKDQIKKWQEQLAASPVAPAPGNFMDILSLLSSLNDNEL